MSDTGEGVKDAQEGAEAVVARIAAVVREHQWWFVGNLGVPGMEDSKDYKCACGWTAGGGIGVGKDPNAHVAAAVVDALGLTPQWTWSWPKELTGTGEPGYGYTVDSREEAAAEADSYMTIVRRYVTAWEQA